MNPVVDLGADQSFCASGSANLAADPGNQNCFYQWSTGSDAGQINVNSSGTYWVNVTNLCNVTATDTVNLYVFPLPEADAGEDMNVCKGDSTQLAASGGISYLWNNSQYLSADNIQNPICTPPQGSVEFIVTVTDENGCVNTDNVLVSADDAYDQEKICIVSVDLETGKNMVVWEKTPDVGIASYNVYRLGTGGNYSLLGNVPFDDLSVFVDSTSEPEKTQYLYKLAVVDTCGNESPKSHYHKTLFLQYTSSEGGVNLLWQDYQIEEELVDFSDFYIYRGSDSTALTVIDTVSGTNVYTDVDPLASSRRMYYRVAGVKPDPCDPAGLLDKKAGSGPFVHSLSNLEDNRLKTNIKDILASKIHLQVYPNPFNEMTKLHFRLDHETDVKLEIFNIMGEQIGVIANQRMYPDAHELIITNNDLQNKEGLYYLRLWLNDEYLTRKIVLR
jgi:hypothetical protein